jgi:putative tryptophan/tyrosine transport system substrate-binding protein
MRRRQILRLLGGLTILAPAGAWSQGMARTYRVGVLSRGAPIVDTNPQGAALIRGLARHGYSVGRNMVLERRAAGGRSELLPRLLKELSESRVEVILVIGYVAALIAKEGTALPVVVFSAGDPVATGLVDSLARPGGHLTGISDVTAELSPKRLELLKELIPELRRVAMLWNAADPAMTIRYQTSEAAAKILGLTVEPLGVREVDDFERVFAEMARSKPDALMVVTDGLTIRNRQRVFEIAAANRLPAFYEDFDFLVRDGGLMYYGPDTDETFDRIADLIDQILRGAKPEDLPFEQPTRFRFVINLKTAKALGLNIPESLLARADEVIE